MSAKHIDKNQNSDRKNSSRRDNNPHCPECGQAGIVKEVTAKDPSSFSNNTDDELSIVKEYPRYGRYRRYTCTNDHSWYTEERIKKDIGIVIIRRDGRIEPFNRSKMFMSIKKANDKLGGDAISDICSKSLKCLETHFKNKPVNGKEGSIYYSSSDIGEAILQTLMEEAESFVPDLKHDDRRSQYKSAYYRYSVFFRKLDQKPFVEGMKILFRHFLKQSSRSFRHIK